MQSETVQALDLDRLRSDREYRTDVARVLLARCGPETDHVELRRRAEEIFPSLGQRGMRTELSSLVGWAATLRQREARAERRRRARERLERELSPPDMPLDYTEQYTDLDEELRDRLVAFCGDELDRGRDGPQALENLRQRHGWPYNDRTFYVGPWKAARLRRRDVGAAS